MLVLSHYHLPTATYQTQRGRGLFRLKSWQDLLLYIYFIGIPGGDGGWLAVVSCVVIYLFAI